MDKFLKLQKKSKPNYIRLFKIFTVNLFFAFISFSSFGQGTFYLPEGYQTYKDNDENEVRCDGDFDHDGKKDLAILCVNSDQSQAIAVVYLTTRYLENGIYSWFPWQSTANEFSFNNSILTLWSNEGKFGTTLKLKYFADLKNMRLIGYESYFAGSGASDGGAYQKTINLLTNEYTVNGKKKKASFDLITLSNIEKYLDYLSFFNTD